MPDFNSPLGRRTFAASAPRIITVPNEDSQFPDTSQDEISHEQELEVIQATRKATLTAAKRINPAAKERIEVLTGLGRCRDVVEFESVSFSIQSLKGGEMREVACLANNALNAVDSYFEARNQTLARSIYAIDGQPVNVVLGTNKLEDILTWIDNMDESLVEYIHNHYLEMVKNNRYKFAIKNDKDAKEVAEEIKK